MTDDSSLTSETIERMIQCVEPAWSLREATDAEGGHSVTYRLRIETATATRTCFLKAAQLGDGSTIPAEARLLEILRGRTAIPVPEVLGVVDEHDDLPSPYFLMDSLPGSDVSYERVGWLSDNVLLTVARQVGAHLGALHEIDAVDSFGLVTDDRSRRLAGGRPSGTVRDVRVADGFDSWRAYLGALVERELNRHASSRFSTLTSRLRTWCTERIERLPEPASPVLGRNDHGFHNLLIDQETGEVTAMLDWGYTVAVAPAYDVQFGAYLFSGAFLSGIADVPDRRASVRDSMLAGYRSTAPHRYEAISTHYPLYEVLAMVRIMNDFELLVPMLPTGTESAVATDLRGDVESILESNER